MRPNIIVLNDPARGIDVGAKTELYRHLRAFAESGKSVIYMSSELEEFLGFASRVIVFRNGSPFDAFAGEAVEGHKHPRSHVRPDRRVGLGRKPAGGLDRRSAEDVPTPADAPSIRIVETPDARRADRYPPRIKIVEFGENGEVRAGRRRMNMAVSPLQPATAEAPRQSRGQGGSPYLLVPITLLFALLIVAVIRAPHLVTSAGLGSALIVATPLILATYALMSVAIAGRGTVDLSIGPLISFINVTLIQLVDHGLLATIRSPSSSMRSRSASSTSWSSG